MRVLLPEFELFLVTALPKFTCKRCARCCAGKFVPIYQSDIDRIEARVEEKFYRKTNDVEKVVTGARHKMLMVEGKCIFLDGDRCRHYELRPKTCRRHPFLVTQRYLLVSSTCPGVDWRSRQMVERWMCSNEIADKLDPFLNGYLQENYSIDRFTQAASSTSSI
jgi:Fe-S-cluster containining protein